jgi:hypothetical protein
MDNDATEHRRVLLLGGIVDSFAGVELRAQVLLAGFALQEIVGEILAANLNFQAIAQKLALLSKLPGLDQAGVDLSEWTRRAVAASLSRNGYVHSLWYLQDNDDPSSGARFSLSARGKLNAVGDVFRIKPETIEELEDLLVELNKLADDVPPMAETLRATGKWAGGTF